MSSSDQTQTYDPLATPTQMAAPASAEPGPPVIPDLAIERELGRGGMGAVWLGRQTYLDRQVAVKALTLAGDEVFASRFRREARILAGLTHPNIVACYQAGMAPDGRPFLIMEFVDGPDLKKHVDATGPLAPAEAARLVAEIAEGLRHAHAQGIIHRDVKPENILLAKRPDGMWTAKLADLGLARPSQPVKGSGHDLTVSGLVLGTPATMAPEQFDNPDAVDQRADIYGLGCVLHHALTGEPAFAGCSFAALVASKVHGPAPDPGTIRPGLPPELVGLCRAMLARDRAQRPDYAAIIAALRTPLAAPRRRTPVLLLSVLGGLLAAAVVAALLIHGAATKPPAPAVVPTVVATVVPTVVPTVVAEVPRPPARVIPGLPALTVSLALFGETLDQRLAGWNISDPQAWSPSEDLEGLPIAGRSGEIVYPLAAQPGRLTGTVTVPIEATQVLVGLRDAEGRTTALKLLPLNGLIANLITQGADGSVSAAQGSQTLGARPVRFTLTISDGRLIAVLNGAAGTPLVIALPAPPVAVVLAAEGKASTLFQDLRAEP